MISDIDFNTNPTECQEEVEKKFYPKKYFCSPLSHSYERLGMVGNAERVRHCGDWLDFADTPDGFKLYDARFCRDRLCPMCSWRRSYKIFGQISQVMDLIAGEYEFLFLTLTVINCKGSDLSATISKMQKAWTSYFVRPNRTNRRAKDVIKGYFKVLEITHNLDKYACKYIKHNGKKKKIPIIVNGHRIPNPYYDTYHPHFHVILAVNKSYFTSRDYIEQDEWLKMWQKAYGDPNITQVYIEKCKPKKSDIKAGEQYVRTLSSAVAEVAKYAVKSSDYIGFFDKDGNPRTYSKSVIDSAVVALTDGLYHRRLCEFGGVFRDARDKLQLDDCEDGDLVHIDNYKFRPDIAYAIYRYGWSSGAYKLTSIRKDGYSLDVETGEILVE